MPSFPSYLFHEAHMGENPYHRLDFAIDGTDFIIVFSLVDIADHEYARFRSEEVGVAIPDNSYDIKFDTLENYTNGSWYEAPKPNSPFSRLGFEGLTRLSVALRKAIDLHYTTYNAKLYMAAAENGRLVKFYNRLVCNKPGEIDYQVSSELGPNGAGYAIKTPRF